MDYEGFLKLVKTRRSIRSFKPDSIPDEYVERIVEAVAGPPQVLILSPGSLS
jgi:nitroreductase